MGGHGRTVARIAVSGAGWWGQGWHLPHLHRRPDAMVAAIVERAKVPRSSNAAQKLDTAQELSDRYSAPVFDSVEALLASSTELDGLLVGVSHADHAHQATLAIDAGIHVLVEKPMTTSVVEARGLASAAEAHMDAGRFFAINNTANWREGCRVAAAAVAAGRIGHVEHVSAHMHSPLLWLFDDACNAGWTQATDGMSGNGFAWGQLSHLLAWVFHVTPLQPTRVFASMGRSESSGADLHDSAVICCEGGASISVSGTAAVPGDAHSDAPVGKSIQFAIFGSEGSLAYAGDDQRPGSGVLELRRRDRRPAHQVLHPAFEFENYEPSGTGGPNRWTHSSTRAWGGRRTSARTPTWGCAAFRPPTPCTGAPCLGRWRNACERSFSGVARSSCTPLARVMGEFCRVKSVHGLRIRAARNASRFSPPFV